MELVALVLAAFLQLASLSLDQLRETIHAIASALAQQYVDASEGERLGHALTRELEGGAFTGNDPDAFAAGVQRFLQAETKDRHLLLWRGAPADILSSFRAAGCKAPPLDVSNSGRTASATWRSATS